MVRRRGEQSEGLFAARLGEALSRAGTPYRPPRTHHVKRQDIYITYPCIADGTLQVRHFTSRAEADAFMREPLWASPTCRKRP